MMEGLCMGQHIRKEPHVGSGVGSRIMTVYSHEEDREVCRDVLDNISVCRHKRDVEERSYSIEWVCVGGKAICDELRQSVFLVISSPDNVKTGFRSRQSGRRAVQI
jgi:hypothetical protein